MTRAGQDRAEMPVGVVIRRSPGATRWARWSWRAVGLLPGAGPADWRELRRAGETVEYHAATLTLTLWPDEAEAYLHNLSSEVPALYLVLREEGPEKMPLRAVLITASPYEGQDYADTGEEIVERIPMSAGLIAWVEDFALRHHRVRPFVRRRRDSARAQADGNGIGEPRVHRHGDVYRAPRPQRRRAAQ